MDDINNNIGIGNTQNSNTSQNNNDPNSFQPMSNLVEDLSGMPPVKDDNKPVEEFPNQINTNTPEANLPSPLETVQTGVQSAVPDLGVFSTTPTPIMDTQQPPILPTDTLSSMGTPVEIPSLNPSTPVTPSETQMPSMETPEVMPTLDTFTPGIQSDNMMSSMEKPEVIPAIDTSTSVIPTETPDSLSFMEVPTTPSLDPTFPPVSPLQELSQPLEQFSTPVETTMPAFKDTEVVNTLTDEKAEKGKGGTAVVIVLIVVIVALLITIGYFAYKIFFA